MWQKEKNVERIVVKDKEIILIGTAHISEESVNLVERIVSEEKPETVGVELCQKRYDTIFKKEIWENTKIIEIVKKGQTQLLLANLLISSFQKRMGEELKIKPGAEMIQAIEAAEKSASRIALIDRDIQITLKRAWREMKFLEKVKFIYILLTGVLFPEEMDKELVEKIKEKDVMTQMIEELGKEIPSVKKVLIDERDIYIANKILAAPGKKIVAVVGAGHLEGIKNNLQRETDIGPLENVPAESRWLKYFSYAVPLIFLSIIVWGVIHHQSAELAMTMFVYWFLIHGILAALGAVLALSHPLTVISAFLSAPFTSLDPTIGAGTVAGLVEAKLNEPRVKDFQDLNEITSFAGFYRNRISRILLVATFVNLGSSLGTFVALPYLIKFI